jgi:hypothetical protein
MIHAWTQTYTPLGGLGLSALVAAIPVIPLLGLLAFWHVRAHIAAIVGLVAAGLIAAFADGMPGPLVLASAGYGAVFGLLERVGAGRARRGADGKGPGFLSGKPGPPGARGELKLPG